MSERADDGEWAQVIPFPRGGQTADRLAPRDYTEAELVDLFFSVFRHPSMRLKKPEEIADIVRRQLGPDLSEDEKSQLTPEDIEWRREYLAHFIDAEGLNSEQLAGLDATDPLFHSLSTLIAQLDAEGAEHGNQYQALEAIRGLRLLTDMHTIPTDEGDWLRLLRQLLREPSQSQ